MGRPSGLARSPATPAVMNPATAASVAVFRRNSRRERSAMHSSKRRRYGLTSRNRMPVVKSLVLDVAQVLTKRFPAAALLAVLILPPWTADAASVPIDLTGVRPGPITVARGEDSVTVTWADEAARTWRATFSLDPSKPLVTSIAAGTAVVMSGARPFYQGETGKRRGGWYAFFDDPASHPDGTRHVQGTLELRAARARSIGERVEIVFDSVRMGSFDGGLAFTFFPGSRLGLPEALLTTNEPD